MNFAAGSDVNWWGTDFNPSQASFASELSRASGSAMELFDDSFEEFLTRSDLQILTLSDSMEFGVGYPIAIEA